MEEFPALLCESRSDGREHTEEGAGAVVGEGDVRGGEGEGVEGVGEFDEVGNGGVEGVACAEGGCDGGDGGLD